MTQIRGQNFVAERECCGSDQQIPEGNHDATALLFAIESASQ